VKVGDLVVWTWNGESRLDKTGIVVSDYLQCQDFDGNHYKNVYWFDNQWVRPIRPEFLEVINESR